MPSVGLTQRQKGQWIQEFRTDVSRAPRQLSFDRICRRQFDEIRNHNGNALVRSDPAQKLQRFAEMRPPALRFKEQHLTNHPQDVPPAFAWRNELLDVVSKENQTHFVIIADG